jgi:signal transduction histidine kinase
MVPDPDDMSSDRVVIAAMIELASADGGDWEATMQHILRVEARVLDLDRTSFWSLRDHGNSLFCEMAYDRDTRVFERGFMLSVGEHPQYFESLLSSPPFMSDDCRADPRLRSLRGYVEAHKVSSLLAFPVWVVGHIEGVLCHEHVGPPRHWSAADQRFAAAVAQTASTALEARARAKAQAGAVRAEFLDRVTRTLGGTLEVDEVARRAMELLVPALGDGADIVLVEDEGMRRVAFDYVTAEGKALLAPLLPIDAVAPGSGTYITQRAIVRRESILLPDLSERFAAESGRVRPEIVAALRKLGTRSMISALLLVAERITGVITMATSSRSYGIDDLRLAEEFARRLATAIENARLHQRAQAAVRRAEAAVRARDEFIALAAHELRTPLTAMQLTVENLIRRAPSASSEDAERIGRSLLKQIKRLDALDAQMLDATLISAQHLHASFAPADLCEVVRDTAESLAALLERHGCALVVRADAPVVGEWDATQLARMFSNLLDNAAKFGSGKPIEVTVERSGDAGTLSVLDHGNGIPPERVPHIFEAFERGVPSTHYGGLGLGLFIAKAIVEDHGGMLTVDNRPGQGATFTARLPLRRPFTNARALPGAP